MLQEVHNIYEFWVDGGEGGGLERETAELVDTIINNQQIPMVSIHFHPNQPHIGCGQEPTYHKDDNDHGDDHSKWKYVTLSRCKSQSVSGLIIVF